MLGNWSLVRTFGVLSLVTIALITAAQVAAEWQLLREELVDWERTSTAESIRDHAVSVLHPEDFENWQTPAAQRRFSEFFARALANPEVVRVKLYSADMRVLWSDEPRLRGVQFRDNAQLRRALAGQPVADLEPGRKTENVYEKAFGVTVELYVPLVQPGSSPPHVYGVVEVYKDPSRRFANFTRDRLVIIGVSLLGAVVLYAALFGIVRRAARHMEAQQADLARQASILKETNEALVATQKQLRASEHMAAVGEVSAAVAHGIRNPLANIRASAQVALDTPDDAQATTKYLRTITEEVDRLGRWLTSLLHSLRPFELKLGRVDLNAILRDLVGLLERRMSAGGITADLHLASDVSKLTADEVQLQQALLAVLENAIEALPTGGTVSVTTEHDVIDGRPAARITIRDTGEGIPADRLPHVFEALYTTKTRGTGLGLAITRKVAEGHGGQVRIESQPGFGAAITIVLPIEAAGGAR
jgi:two-component system, NtrC family, sensor histidine kinase HydH